jgi:hypothetical protein
MCVFRLLGRQALTPAPPTAIFALLTLCVAGRCQAMLVQEEGLLAPLYISQMRGVEQPAQGASNLLLGSR